MFVRHGALGPARFAVTDRHGGVSAAPYDGLNLGEHVGDDPGAVADNRARVAVALGLPPDHVAYMSQVHGRDVAVVERPPVAGAPVPVADGLVTTAPGVALAVLSADCVPVLLAAGSGVLGVAHAGREGVRVDVVRAVVDVMRGLGADPADMVALVGPAICGRCYEVTAGLRDAVTGRVGAARSSTRGGSPSLDLVAGVRAQLREAGVGAVDRVPGCTAEAPELFSHRRDAVTGRIGGFVWRPAGAA